MPSYIKAMTQTGSIMEQLDNIPFTRQYLPVPPEVSTFNREWTDFHHQLLREREAEKDKQTDGVFFTLYDQIKSGLINLTEEEVSFDTVVQNNVLFLSHTDYAFFMTRCDQISRKISP